MLCNHVRFLLFEVEGQDKRQDATCFQSTTVGPHLYAVDGALLFLNVDSAAVIRYPVRSGFYGGVLDDGQRVRAMPFRYHVL